jgi:hypothetical protein
MGNIINTIKAVAALDKAITPVIANTIIKGLENKTDEEAMETLMEIAAPLRGLFENSFKAMGCQVVPVEEDDEDMDEDPDIEIEVHDDEDPDETETDNLIEFLQNTQVALGLDREDLYKLLLIMGVKNIVPTEVHNWVTTHFNEYF